MFILHSRNIKNSLNTSNWSLVKCLYYRLCPSQYWLEQQSYHYFLFYRDSPKPFHQLLCLSFLHLLLVPQIILSLKLFLRQIQFHLILKHSQTHLNLIFLQQIPLPPAFSIQVFITIKQQRLHLHLYLNWTEGLLA